MRIVALTRLGQVRRLAEALNGIADVVNCGSVRDCERALRDHRPHALVVDPVLLGHDGLGAFVRETQESGVPVVFYFPLDPVLIKSVLPLLAQRSTEILLAGIDDSRKHIREIFGQLPQRSVQADLFAKVAPLVMRLPPTAAAAIAAVLLDPEWTTAKELPSRVGASRRTIDRALRRAGCAPLQRWCTVSRLARVVVKLENPSTSVPRAARVGGYDDVRSLRRSARSVLGVHSDDALRQMSRMDFLSRAGRSLTLPPTEDGYR